MSEQVYSENYERFIDPYHSEIILFKKCRDGGIIQSGIIYSSYRGIKVNRTLNDFPSDPKKLCENILSTI